ncbi:NFX1-type zinc finger-containing protein 1 [Serendipita indica DSM 11827]|nr:NFX1-type zinc finger-containing protein 1 [Serendipita indica DSM 11827]
MTPDTDRFTTGFGPVLAAAARQSAPQPTISTNVTASEALQHLSVFCSPTFTFSKPFQIVSFVNLLVNAASKHRSWDNSDSRQFLETLTQSHGLARIEAILTFDNVVTVLNNPRDAIAFSSTYINCLSYFVSEAVLHSTLKQRVNSCNSKDYTVRCTLIHNNFDRIHVIINECMDDIVSRKSFETRPGLSSGFTVFSTLVEILIQYVIRYQNALRDHPVLYSFCHTLFSWHTMWSEGGYIDGWVVEGEQQKQIALSNLGKSIERLANIIERENSAIRRKTTPSSSGGDSGRKQKNQDDTLRRVLDMYYDPPGQLRGVRRHDNDLENIRDISIPPTEQEMLCRIAPFLPANIPSGPHYLDDNSMERLLDIQFRLLREELLAALRVVLQSITHNIHNPAPNNALETLLASEGGKYIAHSGGNDSVMVNLYTSVDPIKVVCDKRGISVAMSVATPPGPARATSIERRAEYWRYACRKRLMPGGLVALIWQTGQSVKIYFGLLSSTPDEIQTNARASSESLVIRVRFFDPIVNLKVMDWIQTSSRDRLQTRIFLVESPVMYESIRPFLEGLKREPTSVPFAQILVHGGHPRVAGLPRYIEADPQFSWDLKSLVRLEHPDRPALRLNPRDPGSTENARQILCSHSRLDRSQVDAMVDCLTKSFVLIQGPPGTGKSFTGVELMRVLLANHRGPILLIAFTNHALDHLLLSVLKANITSKIVRLGSRSSDEEVGEYALENLEKMDPASDSDNRSLYRAYGEMRSVESELKEHLEQLHADEASEEDLIEYLELFYPEHVDEIRHPSQFIRLIRPHEEGWTEVTRARGTQDTLYQYWAHSKDLQWISNCQEIQRKQVPVAANRFALLKPERDGSEDESDESKDDDDLIFETEEQYNLRVLLENAGLRSLPPLPTSNRPLDQLIQEPKVWQMSISERSRISRFWKTEAKKHFIQRHRDIFSHCKDQFESAKQRYDEVRDQMRSRLLRKADIVGCTTTGAAKLASLLFSFKPRILLVEEAGQVLEAHILGALVESIEHVIEIGDPLQLRPTITNYALSCDHPLGGKIYKLDQSTMERLSESGMTMSKLHVQRRMRGQIATLARTTLYPQLIDDESVSRYPNVKGMAKNIFFLHHTNAEGGGTNDESTSKFNQYEAAMTKALVQHLLRQGLYTRSGSIVILCMYLGQLVKVRDELRNSRINVVFDERDLDALRDNGIDVDSDAADHGVELQEVRITDQVLIRTVDNFQGEEADVVILNTVRNFGPDKLGSIGFLKSPNRANVALTRARHGLYVMGNGDLLASNPGLWNQVVQYFRDQDCYGTGLPIACHNHPHDVRLVENAMQLRQISPDGGYQSQVVVDLILGLTIADLDPTSQELDNVTITLRCGHTFTVETLDGVCELGQYYRKHEVTGRWLSPIQRLEAFVKTPCCPTCRRPIEAQRYGRALKRGNLDILERNVATTMARELQSMQQELSTISTAGTDIDVLLPFNVLEERFLSQKDYRTKILTPGRALPIVNERLLGLQMRKVCSLQAPNARRWSEAVKPYLDIYKRASDILAGRAAHMVAYEASYSMLYEHELARVQKGPFAPKYPERVALQSAKTKIGMPPPRADTRFKVEAIWMTIDIRHVLGSLAEKIHSRLSSQASHSQQQLEALQQFIIFIYHSCQLDSNAAIKIAQSSDAYRQELLSSMRQIKTTWRLVRVEKGSLPGQETNEGRVARGKDVLQRLEEARLAARTVRNACSTKSGVNFAMISQEFDAPMEKVFKQWQELGDHLSRPSVFYQPVSDDELYAVIGSFTEYRHRGHWYTCPNGHIFTIADCGGATMTSQCHECGAVIGGTGHATVQGVQQAVNLERIAESQGAVQSPWGWNRNV